MLISHYIYNLSGRDESTPRITEAHTLSAYNCPGFPGREQLKLLLPPLDEMTDRRSITPRNMSVVPPLVE